MTISPSVIRHILTAVGAFAVLIGLNHWLPFIDYINANLDQVWAAGVTVVGFITTLVGYFRKREESDPAVEES